MNVLEQLQSLGFQEEPYRFDTGGGTFDGYAGVDGAGEGPGGTDLSSEISVDYGGTGPSVGDTVGQGAVSGPSGPYGGPQSIDNAQVAAAIAPTIALATELATSPGQAFSLAIEALNDMGFGSVTGLNAANPTQSVAEMQAAQNFAQYGVPAVIAAIPGASTAANIAKLASNLSTGKTTVGAEAVDFALSQLASSLGINKDMAVAMINGDFGKAAANTAMGVFNSALAQATGLPAGVVGFGMNITGAGKAISSEIESAVNAATGVAPTDNVGAMGRAVDQAFGVGPGGTSTGATGTDVSDVAGVIGGDGAPGVVDTTETDVAGGPSSVAPAGFDLSGLAPLLGVAALEDILTPKEKEEQEKEQKRIASPFGMMPYA